MNEKVFEVLLTRTYEIPEEEVFERIAREYKMGEDCPDSAYTDAAVDLAQEVFLDDIQDISDLYSFTNGKVINIKEG